MSNVFLRLTAEEDPLTISNLDKAILREMDASTRVKVLRALGLYLYAKVHYNQLLELGITSNAHIQALMTFELECNASKSIVKAGLRSWRILNAEKLTVMQQKYPD